jgi:hypothetical protein
MPGVHGVDHMHDLGGWNARDLAGKARIGDVARVPTSKVIGDAPADLVELDTLPDDIAAGRDFVTVSDRLDACYRPPYGGFILREVRRMSKIRKLVALGLAGALTAAGTPSSALPVLTNTAAVKAAASDEIAQVRWGWGWGVGALIGGIALGAALARPSYAYYGYPGYGYSYSAYGYGYPSYGYGYPSYGYSYPSYGYGSYGYPYAYGSYYGGYPYGGVRRAYWGGGWGGGWGFRRSWWASARSTQFAGGYHRGGVRMAYYRPGVRGASYGLGVRQASYRGRARHASYGVGVRRAAHNGAPYRMTRKWANRERLGTARAQVGRSSQATVKTIRSSGLERQF